MQEPTRRTSEPPVDPALLAEADEPVLLEAVQRRTFNFFWDGGHPVSGLAYDRLRAGEAPGDGVVTSGGSGFAAMALVVAVARGWVSRAAALERLDRMLSLLVRSPCYHGAFPHFMNGSTGATVPFMRKDDGGDLVETSLLLMGLLCAREYFDAPTPLEASVRGRIDQLWSEVEWTWYTRGRHALYWHWSPNNGWALDLPIRGWNECLITYLLAVAAPRHAVDPVVYHRGFAAGAQFLNRRSYHGLRLPLGPPFGGPLYFAHYSFTAIDPRELRDRYADYWEQNVHHVLINQRHCALNPHGYRGYGADCWGLTSSDDRDGYAAHAPDADSGTLAPTAALSSLPYAPAESLAALRTFLKRYGERLFRRYGFVDAFSPHHGWFADTHLAIDQGPIIALIENHRSGLLWRLFMRAPEIRRGLAELGFASGRHP